MMGRFDLPREENVLRSTAYATQPHSDTTFTDVINISLCKTNAIR